VVVTHLVTRKGSASAGLVAVVEAERAPWEAVLRQDRLPGLPIGGGSTGRPALGSSSLLVIRAPHADDRRDCDPDPRYPCADQAPTSSESA